MLYIVPTPIGNLEDITFRAIRVLKEVDLILAEDTRTSGKLLAHFDITTKMKPYHMHNEHRALSEIVYKLNKNESIALITDAGTPGISDPGFLLIREAVSLGIELTCLPGSTAFVPAIVSSGIPCNSFIFEGFLPLKKGRQTKLQSFIDEPKTIVFYESTHRIIKTLTQLKEILSEDRKIAVCKELSKLHEKIVRGSVTEVLVHFEKHSIKGEFVVVIAGMSSLKKGKD